MPDADDLNRLVLEWEEIRPRVIGDIELAGGERSAMLNCCRVAQIKGIARNEECIGIDAGYGFQNSPV